MECETCGKKVDPNEIYTDWFYCNFCKGTFDCQPERSKREDSQTLIIDGVFKELRRREDNIIEEFGTSSGIRFVTSEGVKKMEPGKGYDRNLNEL